MHVFPFPGYFFICIKIVHQNLKNSGIAIVDLKSRILIYHKFITDSTAGLLLVIFMTSSTRAADHVNGRRNESSCSLTAPTAKRQSLIPSQVATKQSMNLVHLIPLFTSTGSIDESRAFNTAFYFHRIFVC
jgi:hypothetical protein